MESNCSRRYFSPLYVHMTTATVFDFIVSVISVEIIYSCYWPCFRNKKYTINKLECSFCCTSIHICWQNMRILISEAKLRKYFHLRWALKDFEWHAVDFLLESDLMENIIIHLTLSVVWRLSSSGCWVLD